MRILVDIDETCNNLIEVLLEKYNAKYNDSVKIEYITEYEIQKFLKPDCENIFTEFMCRELIENLQENTGVSKVLCELAKDNKIYFLSATHPDFVQAKHNWLKKHFPFYTADMFIVCKDKNLVKGDLLIDDCLDYLKHSPCPHKICFSKPWNTSYTGHTMKTWTEFNHYFQPIIDYYKFIEKLKTTNNIADLINA